MCSLSGGGKNGLRQSPYLARESMTFPGRLRNDERGAVAVIVALALFAIISMMVLTVDVGSLLYKRRIMVNGADAAALAAAQTCARTTDLSDPEQVADAYATDNVVGLNSTDGGIIASAGCRRGTGYVTVRYTVSQQLAFAQVLGLQNPTPVATAATAGWGALGAANAVPIMLEAGHLQGTCRIPDGATVGDKCAFWYNNNDLGNADSGYLNLDLWNVASTASCSNAGSNARGGWIVNGYGQLLDLNGSPPGSSPTYVCVDTGHTSADWQTLHGEEGKIKAFPVNDCGGQVDRDGVLAPCPTTPDKYDIIGFSLLLVRHVYKGNDALGIGTAGQTGSCTNKSLPAGLLLNQTVDLGAFAVSNCAAPATPDSVPFDSN